ncbi:unnamed protein product [Polarella glacialis]|uniref:Uncharacterized protein n=1 Tax=Polarella glacialis TaxID=89957 RepID=A0A813HY63_POLGL|nr:unnamed protein product [Polarella glacialis]
MLERWRRSPPLAMPGRIGDQGSPLKASPSKALHPAHRGVAVDADGFVGEEAVVAGPVANLPEPIAATARARVLFEEDAESDGEAWKLDGQDDTDGSLSGRLPMGVDIATANATPRSLSSTEASYSSSLAYGLQEAQRLQDVAPPLVIEADAPLVDGLRILLVHHLKKTVGANVINLTAGQAELLEHHMSRLESYAQKIVHTLAFATRLIAWQQPFETESPLAASNASSRGACSSATDPAEGEPAWKPREPRCPPKKLKLKDEEILDIFRSAQQEAIKEADWRGIEGPTASRSGDDASSCRSGASASTAYYTTDGSQDDGRGDYLRVISRAMQQPGRTPESFTAEMVDPSQGAMCCGSLIASAARREAMKSSSAMVRWPQIPPDPGGPRSRNSRPPATSGDESPTMQSRV